MGGRTNEGPGTDHVITGPMRDLKKTAPNCADRQRDREPDKDTNKQTDMATL